MFVLTLFPQVELDSEDWVVVRREDAEEAPISVDETIAFVIKLGHVLHFAGETIHRLEYCLEVC